MVLTEKTDVDKLKAVPTDFSKLSDIVKSEVAKMTEYDELKKVSAVQATDTSDYVKKADYNTKTSEIGKKILDVDHDKYITTQEFDKIKENFAARLREAKLATKADISDSVEKTDFVAKLKDFNKYFKENKTCRS